ncbi:MAG: TonB-dependent receptor [Acidobacteriota bacterium]|nr:TonB-dependent receptor [Acidobacteriota bacterium]
MQYQRLFPTAVVCLAVALAVPAFLIAQSYQGGVRGIVTDSAGGILANTKVTLIDEGTNVSRAALSNSAGEYAFSSVDPATYTLITEAPGFKNFERKGVIVGTQQFLTIDMKMEIGAVTDSIQVTEEIPLIESSNASTGQVIDREKLVDLPNLGRNPFLFSKLAQNVVPAGDPRFNRFQDQSGSSQISIAGGPVRGNNYLLDGVPITDFQNRAVIIPSIEAVQEVKLQANTYDAELGRTGGGVFNTFLKSGSNDYHGSLLGYTRQTDWLANNFFLNRSGQPRPDTPFYNFGGSFGGAVRIPKLYDGRNKTFFWLADESYRQKSPLSNDLAVPTALERAGDFSQSFSAPGVLQTIYDPLTTVRDASGNVVRQAFPGNRIPANRLNPVGLAVASFYPVPTKQGTLTGTTNFTGQDILTDRADEFTSKADHEMFAWWHVNASYLHYKSREPSGNLLNNLPRSSSNLLFRKVDATQVNNIFTPNPTTVVSVRYGFNRFPNQTDEVSSGFDPAKLGLPSSFSSATQARAFPAFVPQNFAQIGGNSTGSSVYYSKNLLASVAKYIGRHSFKAGFDYRLIHVDFTDLSQANGVFGFDDVFTRRDPNNAQLSKGTGSDLASLLLGLPCASCAGVTSQAQTATKLYTFVRYFAGYFHDDIRFTPKLTLNVGLRYEFETGIAEQNNRYAVGFDRTVVNPLSPSVRGGVMFAGVNGNPSSCCDSSKTKFAPRIGLAYAINPKTTIRGGLGIFYAPNRYEADSALAPGYTQFTPYVASNDGNLTPANSLSNPFPSGLLAPVGNSAGLLQGVGSSVTVLDQFRKSQIVGQYSFDIQRELPGHVALEVGYVGSLSRHLQPGATGGGVININQLTPENMALGSALSASVANPFFGKGGAGVIGGSTITRSQLLRPYPEFSSVNLQSSSSRARYDSLIVKTQKRFAQGLTFLATWTYSRNRDSSFGTSNFLNNRVGSAQPQNVYDLESEYSRAIVDAPSRFTATASYELPFGKGKSYLNHNRFLNYVAGGWQLNAVSLFQTGFPLAIYQNSNQNAVIGAGAQRPNATGVSASTSGNLESRLDNYIEKSAFSLAPAYTFGNVSRTIPNRGPGTANWDLSMFKTVKITELVSAQFRIEALNAFNTPQFRGPNTAFGNSNFGKITQQANFPRYLQLGARFYF